MQAIARIDAGVCGFHTAVTACSEDGVFVALTVTSDCEKICGLGDLLAAKGAINAYEEISPACESVIMTTVHDCLKGCCAGCAVPVGIFKSLQVAAGLALPRDVTITIEKG